MLRWANRRAVTVSWNCEVFGGGEYFCLATWTAGVSVLME